MFIGIAPGRDEVRTGRPFTGPSGKLLTAVLDAVGIPRNTVYCTNLICWYKDDPTKDEIAICSARLNKEIQLVSPKVIVLLGKLACESILNIPFSKARGAVIVKGNITYLATYHPAASLHKGITAAEKEVQINAAYDLCRDLSKLPELPKQHLEPRYEVVDSPLDAQGFLNYLSLQCSDTPVVIDIETSYDKEYDKSHPFDNDIVCIGIGHDPFIAYVFTESAIKGLVWPTNLRYIFHNGVFDTQEIARHTGQWLPISEDTMLMSYSIDERSIRGLHKLKHLAREYVGSDFYEEDDHGIKPHAVKQLVDGHLVDVEFDQTEQLSKLYEYNAKDVVYTYRLYTYLRERQLAEGTRDMYTTLLLPAAEMLAKSQLRGIHISPKNMLEVINVFEPQFIEAQEHLEAIAAFAGFPTLNLNSPKQLMAMFEAENVILPNTRKATIQDYLDTQSHPFLQTLLKYRTLHKLIRNYLLDIQRHVKNDQRVHPHAFLIGTSTGRLTYRDPAVQTLPKPKTVKELGIIRKIFSATNDDYALLEADYAQIEAWLGAYFSQDPILQQDLESGDWHTQTTESVFNVKKANVTSQEWAFYRDGAKHINYGSMYGEGPEGLTRRPPIGMGCDLSTAKLYYNRWYTRYCVFAKYQQQCKNEAQNIGYITTPFGRKRRFPLIVNDHQLRQAINYCIQSTAGDYTLSSAINLEHKLDELDTHLLFVEHDALYYEVRKEHLKDVIRIITTIMQAPPLPGLPSIKIEIEVGPNLAELVKV